jgi:hypothetical protein
MVGIVEVEASDCVVDLIKVSFDLTCVDLDVDAKALRERYASERALVEFFTSVRPCSVTVSFNFRFLDEVTGIELNSKSCSFEILELLLGLGESSSGTGCCSEAMLVWSACAGLVFVLIRASLEYMNYTSLATNNIRMPIAKLLSNLYKPPRGGLQMKRSVCVHRVKM